MLFSEIQKYIMDNFESYKNEVIKELINYYGEEYRDLIISRVEDTDFIFYINPNFNVFDFFWMLLSSFC